jgi:hypothetical protein
MSLEIPAARRFTAPRTRIAAMTKKAITVVGMKMIAINTRLVLSPSLRIMSSSVSMAQILKFTSLYMARLPTSIQPIARPRIDLVMSNCQTLP